MRTVTETAPTRRPDLLFEDHHARHREQTSQNGGAWGASRLSGETLGAHAASTGPQGLRVRGSVFSGLRNAVGHAHGGGGGGSWHVWKGAHVPPSRQGC